jgi:D-arabinose 1-dehydrogenase-like Zn-dependent alcohol dehydrogenase
MARAVVECEGCQIHCLNCETGNQRLHGFGEDGFFAEYAVIDYRNAIILPESMDLQSAAPTFCAGITGKSINAQPLHIQVASQLVGIHLSSSPPSALLRGYC